MGKASITGLLLHVPVQVGVEGVEFKMAFIVLRSLFLGCRSLLLVDRSLFGRGVQNGLFSPQVRRYISRSLFLGYRSLLLA